jgi:hypothetical protein
LEIFGILFLKSILETGLRNSDQISKSINPVCCGNVNLNQIVFDNKCSSADDQRSLHVLMHITADGIAGKSKGSHLIGLE